MEVVTFARMVAREAGISVVVEDDLDSKKISLEVSDTPAAEVLELVARRLGVELSRVGGAYFLGELRPEDRAVYVRRVRRLSSEELQAAVEVLISDNGRVTAYPDGLVVVGGLHVVR